MQQVPDDSPQSSVVLSPLELEWSRDELLRYLGYRGAWASGKVLTQEIEAEIQRGRSLLEPRGIYSVYPIQRKSARQLVLGQAILDGQVATFLNGADRIAVLVVTVGSAITNAARSASELGDPVAAWTLDALGSYAAEAAADALTQALRSKFPDVGALSPRYSPGYCGMHLTQQVTLFELVDASILGVRLLDSMLMQPTKSVSGVIGIGPGATFAAERSPCERCTDLNCTMRRSTAS